MSDLGSPAARRQRGLFFIKWGGSLITDKRRPRTVRSAVLTRLAGELAEVAAARPGGVVLGHGSGSFGHVEAARHGTADGIRDPGQLAGVSRTQDQAARLHRLVVEALLDAGASPFSVAPASVVTTEKGRPCSSSWEVVDRALDLGLLPVVHGDVALDRAQGSAVISTETVFVDLARDLVARGRRVERVFWLGETEGIWDEAGKTVPEIDAAGAAELAAALGSAAGTDVTGGMRHRLAGALSLAALGAESRIFDGRRPGALGRAVDGQDLGTRVRATALLG